MGNSNLAEPNFIVTSIAMGTMFVRDRHDNMVNLMTVVRKFSELTKEYRKSQASSGRHFEDNESLVYTKNVRTLSENGRLGSLVLKSQGLHEPFPKTEIRTTWKSVVGLEVSAKGCPERAPQSTFEPRVGFIFQKVRSVWEVRPKIAIDSPHPNGSELNRVALTC
ncbi:hypothetical protein V1477_020264, partial [Vespula maculifrons]